jgi:Na+-transporting methylmalonyl-CoA/oxaloacetate decarboxylase beta subunit
MNTFADLSEEERTAYIAELIADSSIEDKFHTWGASAPNLKSSAIGVVAGVGAVYAGLTIAPILTAVSCIAYTGMRVSDKVQGQCFKFFSTEKPRQKEVDALKKVHEKLSAKS